MTSYREHLERIGVARTTPHSYRNDFVWKPRSLRAAIRSMSAPRTDDWVPAAREARLKTTEWTNQCQDVAFDGEHWIFSANSSRRPKAIFTFRYGLNLLDMNLDEALLDKHVDQTITLHGEFNPFMLTNDSRVNVSAATNAFKDGKVYEHIGQIAAHGGFLYVSHARFATGKSEVLVFRKVAGRYTPERVIEFKQIRSSFDDSGKYVGFEKGRLGMVEFQTVNPWDGMLYTSFGGGTIREFFIHEPNKGEWTGRSLAIDPPLQGTADLHPVQGACFSDNGHLYVSSNTHPDGNADFQSIHYYSALNGHELGVIRVPGKKKDRQELEGLCWTPGRIHVVLLDIFPVTESDDVFFKTFTARDPSLV
jgi:hypothetical protein